MKVKIQIGLLIIMFLLSSYLIYNFVGDNSYENVDIIEKITEDEKKFKEEYEKLNGTTNEYNNKEYLNISIDNNNNIKYVDVKKVISLLENGTGVIYFGFPECPWCRNAIPVLIDAANELDINEIYYYNAYDIRDIKHLDDSGNIIVDKEGTDDYYKIVDLLKDHLTVYDGLNDENIKRLYFPTVVFVKDGVIKSLHISTLDSQEDPSIKLTDEQYNELKNIYIKGINDIYEILCDENC